MKQKEAAPSHRRRRLFLCAAEGAQRPRSVAFVVNDPPDAVSVDGASE